MVLAGVVDEYRRRIGLRRSILQVLIEERFEHVAAELERCVAVPFQRSQSRAVVVHTAVAPRAHDQEVLCIPGVLRFGGQIAVNGAPHVFLIPQSLNPHCGNIQGLRSHDFVEGLRLPKHVVGGMLGNLAPPWQLIEACRAGKITSRSSAPEVLVIVPSFPDDGVAITFDCGLIGEVIEVHLAECAKMEPVVSHPTIDHGTHWRSDL